MAEVIHNDALSVEGLSRLLEQYKGKPAFEALLKIYLDSIQEFEDAVFAVRLSMMLDSAVGEQLDFLGAFVGETRNGKDDDVYRVWIRVRIRLNRSFGEARDIIECLRLATNKPFEYREYDDACFAILFSERPDFPNDLALIAYLAKAAGIGLSFVYPTDDAHVFRFKNIGASDDPNHGFSSTV